MAAQGLRDLGEGHEQVANSEELAALRARARRINMLTIGSALVATLLVAFASR
jgi:hypothetical protein